MLIGSVTLVHSPAADLGVPEDDGVTGHLAVWVGRGRCGSEMPRMTNGQAGDGGSGQISQVPSGTSSTGGAQNIWPPYTTKLGALAEPYWSLARSMPWEDKALLERLAAGQVWW